MHLPVSGEEKGVAYFGGAEILGEGEWAIMRTVFIFKYIETFFSCVSFYFIFICPSFPS